MNPSKENLTEIKKEIIKGAMDNSGAIIESWKTNLGRSPFKLTRENLSRELNKISPEVLKNTINRYENSLKIEKGGGRRGQKGGNWLKWLLYVLAASEACQAVPTYCMDSYTTPCRDHAYSRHQANPNPQQYTGRVDELPRHPTLPRYLTREEMAEEQKKRTVEEKNKAKRAMWSRPSMVPVKGETTIWHRGRSIPYEQTKQSSLRAARRRKKKKDRLVKYRKKHRTNRISTTEGPQYKTYSPNTFATAFPQLAGRRKTRRRKSRKKRKTKKKRKRRKRKTRKRRR